MARATHDRTRDHRGTESIEVTTLPSPIAGYTNPYSLLLQLAVNRTQQPSIEDTSGATLGELEIEVNKLKAVLRAAGIIGGAPRVYAAAIGTGAGFDATTKNRVALPETAGGAGVANDGDISIPAAGVGAAYPADPGTPEGSTVPAVAAGTGLAQNLVPSIRTPAELSSVTGTASDATLSLKASAGIAGGTGAALDTTPGFGILAELASATGVAFDATVTT